VYLHVCKEYFCPFLLRKRLYVGLFILIKSLYVCPFLLRKNLYVCLFILIKSLYVCLFLLIKNLYVCLFILIKSLYVCLFLLIKSLHVCKEYVCPFLLLPRWTKRPISPRCGSTRTRAPVDRRVKRPSPTRINRQLRQPLTGSTVCLTRPNCSIFL